MTEKNIYRALGELDPALVEKAAPEGKIENNAREKRKSYLNKRILVAAACLVLAVSLILGGNHLYGLFNGQPQPPEGLQGNTETPPVGSLDNPETYPPYNPSSGDGTIPGKPLDEPDLNIQSLSLMTGMKSNDVTARNADEAFIQSQMMLALKLFKASVAESGKNDPDANVLISPLSIQLALAMTANGADGETREEMEKLLGGNIPLEHLNEYLKTYTTNLPSTDKSKFNIANSIWFPNDEDRLTVKKDFLQTNADYYGAAAYKSAFDDQTVNDINQWVLHNTEGMIDRIVDCVNDDAIMYLINTLMFDAEWDTQYDKGFVKDGEFFASNGTIQKVSMMSSMEPKCFATENATGFFKQYEGGRYSFVGILPSEVLTLDEYIRELDSEELLKAMNTENGVYARAKLPKFSCEYDTVLNDPLKSLGMSSAFNSFTANFSKLGRSSFGGIYINEVRHKTSIDINEVGTRAGAVTSIGYSDGAGLPTTIISITLDRPFLYMIVDNATNLPIFMGTVNSID